MLDELWYLADEADQRAEQAYHRLTDSYDDDLKFTQERFVSRQRFRTLADRIRRTGAPYGAHSLVYRSPRELLLVRHEAVGLWVLPGGEQENGETFQEAARRELAEEAGIDADYEGLAFLTEVELRCDDHTTWGVMPVFAAQADAASAPEVADPDGEITAAKWFEELPTDTRDRPQLRTWREQELT